MKQPFRLHYLFICALCAITLACNKGKTATDFNTELVELKLKYADGKYTYIEFPFNDDDHYTEEQTKTTKPELAEILVEKGFKPIEQDFTLCNNGTFQKKVILKNDSLTCRVNRDYKTSKLVDCYYIEESIACWKK